MKPPSLQLWPYLRMSAYRKLEYWLGRYGTDAAQKSMLSMKGPHGRVHWRSIPGQLQTVRMMFRS